MATAAVTYSFTSGTTAVSAQVNQDFTDLVTFLNTNVVHVDGSKTMTGALTLAASDPASANQAARKSYVDLKALWKGFSTRPSISLSGGTMPATDTQILLKGGEEVATTDALGAISTTFATAFPTTLVGVIITIANASMFNNSTTFTSAPAMYAITQASTTGFVAKFGVGGGGGSLLASTSMAFSWIAFGN